MDIDYDQMDWGFLLAYCKEHKLVGDLKNYSRLELLGKVKGHW